MQKTWFYNEPEIVAGIYTPVYSTLTAVGWVHSRAASKRLNTQWV